MAEQDTITEAAPPTKEKLNELTTAANLLYSLKNFTGAADLYSEATELQAELNGEMAPENAELLYTYGRCLYKVAIAKSDVLGGKVAQEDKKSDKKKKKVDAGEGSSSAAANGSTGAAQAKGAKDETKEATVESKPYFQLTGDENWTDSEDEEGEGEEGGAEGEDAEADDFANAYEILDIARVLLSRQLEAQETSDAGTGKGKGKAEDSPESQQLKERLADTHDLLAEISLENERFTDAISDSRASLELRKQLLPLENSILAEAHYKLSLALEFASVTAIREAEREQEAAGSTANGNQEQEAQVDMELRREAGDEMEAAIASLEARLKKEQAAIEGLSGEKKEEQQLEITNVSEMLEEMRQRLIDLRADPTKQAENPLEGMDPSLFTGLLGSMLGADPAVQKAKIEEASKGANDLSGLVRHKKKDKPTEPISNGSGSGKRKLEVEDEGLDGKRARTEEL